MKKIIVSFVLLFFIILMGVALSAKAQSRPNLLSRTFTYKPKVEKIFHSDHALTIDLLGRGGLYALGYEYSVSTQVSAGFGYSYLDIKANPVLAEARATVQVVPIYSHIYIPYGSHRPYFSAGVSLVSVKGQADLQFKDVLNSVNAQQLRDAGISEDAEFKNDASAFLAIPMIGAGYELRFRSNSFIRINYLAFVADRLNHWGGLTMGVGL
jgi:hypothetical protein